MKEAIFSDTIVNNGRQQELDMAKAILIVFLAYIHCTIECTPEPQLAHGIPYLFDSVIGGPLSAPMYMFAMGVGMVYTSRHTPRDYVRRGIRLGIVGFVLNICRFLIPFLIGYLATGDWDKYIAPLPYRMLGNDIMQFACLSMLLIALFVKLGLSDIAMLSVSFGMSVLGMFFNGLDTGTLWGNIFLGHIIGIEDAAGQVSSDFSLLGWTIVPVFGYVFGKRLQHVKNKKLFYGIISPAAGLIAVVYFTVSITRGYGMFGEGQNCYYHMFTWETLVCLAAAVGVLGLYYAISRHLPEKVLTVFGKLSRDINSVYCVHWVFVIMSTNVILYILRGTQELSIGMTLLLSTGINIVAIPLAHFWTARKQTKPHLQAKADS